MEQACSLAVISVSRVSFPLSIASITRRSVIIFVMEAGGIGASALYSKRIFPVLRSASTADFAEKLIPSAKAALEKENARQKARIIERSFFIVSPFSEHEFLILIFRNRAKNAVFVTGKAVFA